VKSLWILLLVLAPLVAFAGVARADDDVEAQAEEEAGAHFNRGKELFDEGDYGAALVEFQRAYQLSPNWRVLFNIGQVQYQLQDYPAAKQTLERYLKEGGSEIPPDRRTIVRSDIERLKLRVAYLRITVNVTGATVAIDDKEIGTSPLDGEVAVSAGRRKVSATRKGAPPATRFVEVAGGDTLDVALEVGEGSAGDPGDGPEPEPGSADEAEGGVPWASWAVTAGFGVGTLVFGLLALNASTDLADAKERATDKDELDEDRNRTLGFAITTDVLLAATAIAGAVSLYLTITGSGDPDETSVELHVRPGGATLEGRF
jgi:hypothetical protein